MWQPLQGSQDRWDPGPLANLAQQSLRGVFVSLPGIRSIGPHRVVDDLRRLFQLHVQSGLE